MLLPVKTGYVKHWEVRPNGNAISSSELLEELGFGLSKRFPRITPKDSMHFTIYPNRNVYDTWNGKW
jgi:hypothetical protein